MSESSAPAAAADEPVVPEPGTPGLVDRDQADPEPVTDVFDPVEAAPPGRHRRADGGRTIVLSARTMAVLRLARTVTPARAGGGHARRLHHVVRAPRAPDRPRRAGDVTTAVSSSGSLAAVTEQNLGFTKAGQIKSVEVKVGQQVTAGQVLATIDDAPARRVLEQQQGELDSQRAALTRQVNATTVAGAQNTTNQAQDILAATQDQRDATLEADGPRSTGRRSSSTSPRTRGRRRGRARRRGGRVRGLGRQLVGLELGLGLRRQLGDPGRSRFRRLGRRLGRRLRQRQGAGGEAEEARGRAAGRGRAGGLARRPAPPGRTPPCSQVATAQSAANRADQQVEAARTDPGPGAQPGPGRRGRAAGADRERPAERGHRAEQPRLGVGPTGRR